MIQQWLQSGLPGFLVGLSASAVVVSLMTWLLGLAVRRVRTELRLTIALSGFLTLLLLPGLAHLGVTRNVGKIDAVAKEGPAFQYEQAQSRSSMPHQTVSSAASIPSTPGAPQPKAELDLPKTIAFGWLVVSSLLIALVAFRHLLIYRWLAKNATPVRGEVSVAKVGAPFCGGLFRPFIVLPTDFDQLDTAEQNAVLAHEQAHLQHRHPIQVIVADVVSAMFGWIPFVRLLRGQLDYLHERQADEAVVRQGGDGVALAKSLVLFAERVHLRTRLRPTLSMIRTKSTLQDRVERLARPGEPPMQPKKTTIVLTGMAMLGVSASLAMAMQVRENPLEETKSYLAFLPGKVWTYEVKAADGKVTTRKMTALAVNPDSPFPVYSYRLVHGSYKSYGYWMATDKGLKPVDRRFLNDEPGYRINNDVGIRLPVPNRTSDRWSWSENFRGQTGGVRAGEAPKTPPPTEYVGRVISVDTPVTVPAGTYKATVIEVQSFGGFAAMHRAYWVKNVGCVKQETLDAAGNVIATERLLSVARYLKRVGKGSYPGI